MNQVPESFFIKDEYVDKRGNEVVDQSSGLIASQRFKRFELPEDYTNKGAIFSDWVAVVEATLELKSDNIDTILSTVQKMGFLKNYNDKGLQLLFATIDEKASLPYSPTRGRKYSNEAMRFRGVAEEDIPKALVTLDRIRERNWTSFQEAVTRMNETVFSDYLYDKEENLAAATIKKETKHSQSMDIDDNDDGGSSKRKKLVESLDDYTPTDDEEPASSTTKRNKKKRKTRIRSSSSSSKTLDNIQQQQLVKEPTTITHHQSIKTQPAQTEEEKMEESNETPRHTDFTTLHNMIDLHVKLLPFYSKEEQAKRLEALQQTIDEYCPLPTKKKCTTAIVESGNSINVKQVDQTLLPPRQAETTVAPTVVALMELSSSSSQPSTPVHHPLSSSSTVLMPPALLASSSSSSDAWQLNSRQFLRDRYLHKVEQAFGHTMCYRSEQTALALLERLTNSMLGLGENDGAARIRLNKLVSTIFYTAIPIPIDVFKLEEPFNQARLYIIDKIVTKWAKNFDTESEAYGTKYEESWRAFVGGLRKIGVMANETNIRALYFNTPAKVAFNIALCMFGCAYDTKKDKWIHADTIFFGVQRHHHVNKWLEELDDFLDRTINSPSHTNTFAPSSFYAELLQELSESVTTPSYSSNP
jgi:hypothetical protein